MAGALILGATGGIGGAMLRLLAAQGWQVCGLSRSRDGLDVTLPDSLARLAEGLQPRRFDLIVNTIGALTIDGHGPEKTIAALDAGVMARQFAVNAIGAALVLRHFSPLLPRDRRAVLATLSARVGSIGDNRLGGWISYRAAKAALNQIVRTAAIELARSHPQAVVVALHPGTVATGLSRDYLARHPAITPAVSAQALLDVMARLTPDQTGSFWDWRGQPVPW